MAKPFIPVVRTIPWLAMNAAMVIRLLMTVHADVVPIANGVEAPPRVKKLIVAHQEHYSTDGTITHFQLQIENNILYEVYLIFLGLRILKLELD